MKVANDKFAEFSLDKMPGVRAHLEENQLEQALKERMEELADALLGPPNRGSRPNDIRYGRKGGLSINAVKGEWCEYGGPSGGPFQLIAFVQDLTLRQALAWGRNWLLRNPQLVPRSIAPFDDEEHEKEKARKFQRAMSIWSDAKKFEGSLAEEYLKRRIGEPALRSIGSALSDLRCAARCYHDTDEKHRYQPAMIALLRDIETNEPRAIHRTYLTADGRGKSYSESPKLSLGSTRGTAFKLTQEVDDCLGIAEGIETALSLRAMGWKAIWAVGGPGMKNFAIIERVKHLAIFADNDERRAGVGFATSCQERWLADGRDARIIMPKGKGDWNDVWKKERGLT